MEYLRHGPAGASGAGDLPDPGGGLLHRPAPDRHRSVSGPSWARCWRACSSVSSTSRCPPIVKNVFFDLFLFTTGYKVGPQFFRGLKKDALPQLAVTVVLCVTCLISAFTASKLLGYDMGTAAGLLAGAFTESTVIGTAADAINRLDLPAAEKTALVNNIPVAYAVTYLVGTAFIVWFLPNIGPRLMGVDLREESRKLQAQMVGGSEAEPGVHVRLPEVRGSGLPRDERSTAEPDRRLARGDAGGPACLHLADPSRRRDHRARAGHDHPSGRRGGGDDALRAPDGAGCRDRPRGGRYRAPRLPGRGPRRGRHEPGDGRQDARRSSPPSSRRAASSCASSCGSGSRCRSPSRPASIAATC